ncbi:hypothetical protein BGZ75_004719 [Mortierella antarctica]|nr:hypothetical protein BGZ75_004719 [Mortierella antarctica]
MTSPQDQHSQERSVQLQEKVEQQADSDSRDEGDSAVARLEIGADGINGIRSNTGSNPSMFKSSGPIETAENVLIGGM